MPSNLSVACNGSTASVTGKNGHRLWLRFRHSGYRGAETGCSKAIGIDIDPQAIPGQRDNAERNGVSDRLESTTERSIEEMKADVVVANVLTGPLRELAPLISVLPVHVMDLVRMLRSDASTSAFNFFWLDLSVSRVPDDQKRHYVQRIVAAGLESPADQYQYQWLCCTQFQRRDSQNAGTAAQSR